jgi:hypothetical protein
VILGEQSSGRRREPRRVRRRHEADRESAHGASGSSSKGNAGTFQLVQGSQPACCVSRLAAIAAASLVTQKNREKCVSFLRNLLSRFARQRRSYGRSSHCWRNTRLCRMESLEHRTLLSISTAFPSANSLAAIASYASVDAVTQAAYSTSGPVADMTAAASTATGASDSVAVAPLAMTAPVTSTPTSQPERSIPIESGRLRARWHLPIPTRRGSQRPWPRRT